MAHKSQHAPLLSRPFLSARFQQAALASLLMFVAGSTFSLGVFIPAVEAAARPLHALNGVWETAMGAMHFLSAPIMIITAMYLDAGTQHVLHAPHPPWTRSKNFRVRILSLLSLIAFACFAVAAHGAAYSNPVTIFIGVAIQAFPLAIVYLLSIEVLLAWFPHNSGLAVGASQTAFGLGTIVLTQLFSVLLASTNHINAIFLASCCLTTGAVLPTLFMRWPSQGEVTPAEELQPLYPQSEQLEKLPWHRLICLRDFWLYLIAIFTTGATYMLNPYYFKLGTLFNAPFDQLVLLFNLGNLVATLLALFGTAMTDVVRFGSGFWFSGAKNLMIVFMLMQTALLFAMIAVNNAMNFWAFVVIKSLMKIVMACHAGYAAILARDLFGAQNSCIVFGFGAGLALGGGEGVSAWLMAAVEATVGHVKLPSDYNPFYWIGGVWSLVGLFCVLAVDRHKSARAMDTGTGSR